MRGIVARLSAVVLFCAAASSGAQTTTVPGNVPGEFAVSPMGAATYRIPIAVPPGVAGMEPKLALSYNSQAGNGIAGVGWSIEGLSAITRCPQTMASDGVRGRINYNKSDVYCLDGQRLMLVAGIYGDANSEYRTEVDSFSRIRMVGVASGDAINGPASFVVQTKAGLTLEYGTTPDSQIEAQGKTRVRVWALSRMVDAKGNSVSFAYTENNPHGEYVLNSITYGNNSVVFTYETRSDTSVGYEVGSKVSIQQRLKQIETRIGSNTVQRSTLSYSGGANTGRSRLQSVTQCAADNTCLAPLTFGHSDSADLGKFNVGTQVINESVGSLYSESPSSVRLFPKFSDLNGDGYIDALYAFTSPAGAVVYRLLGKGDGTFQPATLIINVSGMGSTVGCSPGVADLNNDGKVDLLYVCPVAAGARVIRWLGNGDGNFQPESLIVNVTGLGSFDGYVPHVADINGDGIVDVLMTRANSSAVTAYKWIGKGDGTFQPEALSTQVGVNYSGYVPQLADLDGDGLTDLVYLYAGEAGAIAYWLRNNGAGSFQAPVLAINSNAFGGLPGCVAQTADLNNDGNADLVYSCAVSTGAYVYRWMGNGDGTFQAPSVGVNTTGYGSFLGYVPHLVDINGDGVLDAVFTLTDASGVYVYRWQGHGNGSFFDTVSALVAKATDTGGWAGYSATWADLNGDGLSDLIYYNASSKGAFAQLWRGKGVIPDRLTTVSNATGTMHQVNYKLTSDRSVYTTDMVMTYPRVEMQAPIQVISSMDQNNGLGGFNTTTYRYGNLMFEHSSGPGVGRGVMGFNWTLSEELVSGVKLYTEYQQRWPYVGNIYYSQTLVGGRIVKQASTTYACIQTNLSTATTACGTAATGKVYFSYVANSVERSWDLNGTELPSITTTTTYGGTTNSAGQTVQLGDATSVQVDINQGAVLQHRKTTTNTYATANVTGSNWILGRLTRASVLSFSADSPAAVNNITRTSSFEYDVQGLLTKETVEPDRPQNCLKTTYTYDAYGNRASTSSATCIGASGNTLASAATARTSSVVYAAQTVLLGGVSYATAAGVFATTSTNALTQSETKQYDPRNGQAIRLTGPNGLTTTWTYDGFGRKTQETRADGTRTTWQYKLCAPQAQPRDVACPASIGGAAVDWYVIETLLSGGGLTLAPPKLQFYDTLGRVVRVQAQGFDGSGSGPTVVQDTLYNSKGQAIQKSIIYALAGGDPKWSTYSYDALGRVTQEVVPDGSSTATTSLSYNGLAITTTNAQGQIQTKTKNAAGQLASVKDAQSYDLLYTYDALGQLVQTTATGATTKLSYDQRGRKIRMEDPTMGVWDYAYNAFGELVWQSDSLGQITTFSYDSIGRLVKRTEPDLISQWSYDKKFDGTTCGKGIGKLCEATANNGYRRLHSYDGLGRPTSTATALDSSTALATVSQAYNVNTGRLDTQTWPTGYQATYSYTALGFLKQVSGAITGDTKVAKLEVMAMDAQGRVTQYRQGGQITTVKNFDAVTSKINSIQTTLAGQAAGNLLNHGYSYDKLGNLLGRQDFNSGLIESFAYDSLNRLSMATTQGGGLASPQTVQVLYDSLGNIKYKSDVGYYNYDPSHANRLNQITLTQPSTWGAIGAVSIANSGTRALSYAFDDTRTGAKALSSGIKTGNGNLWYTVSQDFSSGRHTVRWETYTSFNQPLEIKYGNLTLPTDPTNTTADRTLAFLYGPEHQRIKQTVTLTSSAPSSMEAGSTYYLNGNDSQNLSYEKEIKASGLIEHRHFLSAGGITFALYVKREGTLGTKPANSLNYWHQDHLGSLAAISNESGVLVERLAYDPWGKRRNVNGTNDKLDALYSPNTDRGYTQHEHLDEVGVIHMNGRIYDPLIGRFMSADPFIQSPENLQGYNRYAYVLNNPLAFTDPSGYFSFKKFIRFAAVTVITAVISYYTFGVVSGFVQGAMEASAGVCFSSMPTFAAVMGASAAGFVQGLIASAGNLDAAAHGMISGALFAGAGQIGTATSFARYAAHAAAGCISAVAGGRKCGSEAVAALFGKFTTNEIDGNISNILTKGVVTAVAGGIGSAIGGRNFKNGATTATYGYLFNYLSFKGTDYVNQLDVGNDAHATLQLYAKGLAPSDVFTDTWSDGDGTWFGGRPDIGLRTTRELWEIKSANLGQTLLGSLQLERYVSFSGLSGNAYQAGSADFIFGGATSLTLTGTFGTYTYQYAGNGVITYGFQASSSTTYIPTRYFAATVAAIGLAVVAGPVVGGSAIGGAAALASQ